jgi:hypothetical protein
VPEFDLKTVVFSSIPAARLMTLDVKNHTFARLGESGRNDSFALSKPSNPVRKWPYLKNEKDIRHRESRFTTRHQFVGIGPTPCWRAPTQGIHVD